VIKTILGLVFNRWVLMAVLLLAVALAIWIVGPLVAIADVRPLETAASRWTAIGLVAALVIVVVAWVGGAFVGAAAAAAISRRWPRTAAVCVGLVVVAAVVAATQAMPGQPRWMTIAGLLLPVPAALFAAWPLRKRATKTD
jgi:hypothetical protein